jgi:hypothetical protein
MTATERIADIATRAVKAGLPPADVIADTAERDFMRAHSWDIWTTIAALRSGKPVSQTTAKRTTVTVDSDRTTIVVDDDPPGVGDAPPDEEDPDLPETAPDTAEVQDDPCDDPDSDECPDDN